MPSSGSWSVGDGCGQVWVGVSDGGVSGGQDTGTAGYIKLRKVPGVFLHLEDQYMNHFRLHCKTPVCDSLMKAECTCLKKG